MTEGARLNWIDRAVAYLSPSRGAARAQARVMIDAMLSYEAARRGRRTDGWVTTGSSADAEISVARSVIRERTRDLVRNNPHAARGLSVIVGSKIGTGILTQASGPNARINKRIDERWKRWIERCEVSGKLDLSGVQSLAERTRSESGESLIRFVPTKQRDRFDVPFRLQVLEADYIDSTKTVTSAGGVEIREGIEYSQGVPIAYWLFESHPGDLSPVSFRRGYTSVRVPASDVIHYFKPLRPGQTRGVSDFASVIVRLRALDDYDDAEVMRKKIAACLVAFVTTSAGLPAASIGPVKTDATGKVETMNPGMVSYLRPGEQVFFSDPKPSSDYESFMSVQLHAIAAGLNIPHELLTGDLSEVNYSSLRGGLVQFRSMVESDQWQLVVPQVCNPIRRRFLADLAQLDPSIDPETPSTYTPPRFALLDPAKEVPAMIDAIKGGLKTWGETVRGEGYDPSEQLDEYEAWQKDLTRRGVVMTSDARTGMTAPAPAPATPTEEEAAA